MCSKCVMAKKNVNETDVATVMLFLFFQWNCASSSSWWANGHKHCLAGSVKEVPHCQRFGSWNPSSLQSIGQVCTCFNDSLLWLVFILSVLMHSIYLIILLQTSSRSSYLGRKLWRATIQEIGYSFMQWTSNSIDPCRFKQEIGRMERSMQNWQRR